jgi:alkanesulfonate monooxygenase SsuD/methylene tetrahydromethanopterin reductase-like flavin-dependent oxidoreductase (luciferase family)
MEFAGRHAEVIFATFPDAEFGAAQLRELSSHAERFGRDPKRVKVLQGSFLMTARTREELREKIDQFSTLTSTEGELAKLCAWMGFDLAAYPPDMPIMDIPIEASRSLRDFLRRFSPEQAWTISDVRSIGRFSRRPHRRTGWLVGTPAQVVDQMEDFLNKSGVAGFNLIPCPPTSGIDDICDLIVPELQRRGLFRREYGPEGQTLRERYFGEGAVDYA